LLSLFQSQVTICLYKFQFIKRSSKYYFCITHANFFTANYPSLQLIVLFQDFNFARNSELKIFQRVPIVDAEIEFIDEHFRCLHVKTIFYSLLR